MTGAKVSIWGIDVGGVIWDADRNLAVFEFDKNFAGHNIDLAPITMPLDDVQSGQRIFSFPTLNEDTFHKLPGLLADSLPDHFGNQLIDLWLAQNNKSIDEFTPVQRLCYVGQRGMGALEYSPSINDKASKEDIQLAELVDIASEIVAQKKTLNTSFDADRKKALTQIIAVGTSAGGMRPKAIIALNKKDRSMRSGYLKLSGNYEHWILKFDGIQDQLLGEAQGYGKIEYIYSLMAKKCGIAMTECKLLEENGRAHFMTKRFDRKNGEKIHMQTLCGMAHYDFNNIGSTSYEQLFYIMLKLRLGQDEMEQMFRRLVFNVVGKNQDDHTKNVSFILEKGGAWKLAPAYDLTYNFNPNAGRNTNRHQMSVRGKRTGITRSDLTELAVQFSIKKPELIIDEVVEVFSEWRTLGKQYGVPSEKVNLIFNNLVLV
ncbi:MAG: type II toxin-antitoxin system HipA family toxin [Vicingaceae bacterium]